MATDVLAKPLIDLLKQEVKSIELYTLSLLSRRNFIQETLDSSADLKYGGLFLVPRRESQIKAA